ncbi:MAG: hypothetical protein N2505_06705, partial [Endomicrobia bacterium]|nr:hypothetical protein [Endomicrobiia bacterium]
MEKVYSLSQEQKYKNFIVKVLYEGANTNYMKQNYKKAYEYTTKALKYSSEDEKINQLHKILVDLLEKEKIKTQKVVEEKKQNITEITKQEKNLKKEPQQSSTQKKDENYQIESTTTPSVAVAAQVQIVENKLYKILFFVLLSFMLVVSIVGIFL